MIGARQIPVRAGQPAQRLEVRLDDRSYVFHLRYLEAPGWWLMDIHDAQDRPLLPGRKLVPLHPLTRLASDPRVIRGDLWVIGPPRMPTLDSLGDQHQLVHIPPQDDTRRYRVARCSSCGAAKAERR